MHQVITKNMQTLTPIEQYALRYASSSRHTERERLRRIKADKFDDSALMETLNALLEANVIEQNEFFGDKDDILATAHAREIHPLFASHVRSDAYDDGMLPLLWEVYINGSMRQSLSHTGLLLQLVGATLGKHSNDGAWRLSLREPTVVDYDSDSIYMADLALGALSVEYMHMDGTAAYKGYLLDARYRYTGHLPVDMEPYGDEKPGVSVTNDEWMPPHRDDLTKLLGSMVEIRTRPL